MNTSQEITDASDWPKLELREFEQKLRCPVCYDFFRGAVMIRGCSHDFCSLCIRKHLVNSQECPRCSPTDLEINRILDDLIALFKVVRADLLATMKPVAALMADETANVTAGSGNILSLSVASTSMQKRSCPLEGADSMSTDSQGDKVQCPICGIHFPPQVVENHVDFCLLRGQTLSTESAPRIKPQRKRLAKPVYNLLKDNDIRKLLAELKLPLTGDREGWIRRHSEFVLLYNSECDAPDPKSMDQLRSELKQLERAWNKKIPVIQLDDADFENSAAEYRKRNSGHFKDLLNQLEEKGRKKSKN